MPPDSSLGYFITVRVTKLKFKKPKPNKLKTLTKNILMMVYFYSVHQHVAATFFGNFPLLNNYQDDSSYFGEFKHREEATII